MLTFKIALYGSSLLINEFLEEKSAYELTFQGENQNNVELKVNFSAFTKDPRWDKYTLDTLTGNSIDAIIILARDSSEIIDFNEKIYWNLTKAEKKKPVQCLFFPLRNDAGQSRDYFQEGHIEKISLVNSKLTYIPSITMIIGEVHDKQILSVNLNALLGTLVRKSTLMSQSTSLNHSADTIETRKAPSLVDIPPPDQKRCQTCTLS